MVYCLCQGRGFYLWDCIYDQQLTTDYTKRGFQTICIHFSAALAGLRPRFCPLRPNHVWMFGNMSAEVRNGSRDCQSTLNLNERFRSFVAYLYQLMKE